MNEKSNRQSRRDHEAQLRTELGQGHPKIPGADQKQHQRRQDRKRRSAAYAEQLNHAQLRKPWPVARASQLPASGDQETGNRNQSAKLKQQTATGVEIKPLNEHLGKRGAEHAN